MQSVMDKLVRTQTWTDVINPSMYFETTRTESNVAYLHINSWQGSAQLDTTHINSLGCLRLQFKGHKCTNIFSDEISAAAALKIHKK